MHRSKRRVRLYVYSITSSARTSSMGGMVRPRAFAVLRLMVISYFPRARTGLGTPRRQALPAQVRPAQIGGRPRGRPRQPVNPPRSSGSTGT
jgi:hypothetical protein